MNTMRNISFIETNLRMIFAGIDQLYSKHCCSTLAAHKEKLPPKGNME